MRCSLQLQRRLSHFTPLNHYTDSLQSLSVHNPPTILTYSSRNIRSLQVQAENRYINRFEGRTYRKRKYMYLSFVRSWCQEAKYLYTL
mgnify:CR=1 FL=1